ncbi:MAG TPA: helix-turn-helix domain-containing protein [Pseudonocardia sp.]
MNPPRRVSQRDRRQAAERKIIDAAVTVLIERGYAATTTLEVQKLAGVSRGVLLHYYGSRNELINAAIRHLYATRIGEVRLQVAERASTSGLDEDWALLLWNVISGPVGRACLELLVQAQRDAEISGYVVPLEREFGRANLELCQALLGERRASHPRFREFCLVVINSMLGAAAGTTAPGTNDESRMLNAWRQLPDAYFGRETTDD